MINLPLSIPCKYIKGWFYYQLNSFKNYNYYEQVAKNLELDSIGKKILKFEQKRLIHMKFLKNSRFIL